jgi:Putative metallopeptidase
MQGLGSASRALFAAAVGLAAGFSTSAMAQSQNPPGTIADNDSIFVDGKTFKITPGKAKGDAAAQIRALGARELGPGAIIFRSGKQLYIVDAPLLLQAPARAGGGDAYVAADDLQPDRIRIQYDPPKNPEHHKLYEMLRQEHALEMVQQMLSPFRLPVDLTIKTLGCDGLINSWYNTDDSVPTVHMCYELLQNILQTSPAAAASGKVMSHDAIVGQSLFWTLHEVGHAMFDILELPLFGREEDAADQFAGYMMLQLGKDQAHRFIEGAAYSAEEFMMDPKQMANYASVHGLPQQRFYNLLCLAYGADPKLFSDVMENVLPKRRADNCEYEYQTFSHAFGRELSRYVDPQLAKSIMDTTWFPEQHSPPPAR